MIHTLIYEDNSDLRGALAALIDGTDGYELTGAFEVWWSVLRPDEVIMDIGLSGMSGIEGVARLKKAHPHVEVLILTVFDDDDQVFQEH